jgi:hypothetical protein
MPSLVAADTAAQPYPNGLLPCPSPANYRAQPIQRIQPTREQPANYEAQSHVSSRGPLRPAGRTIGQMDSEGLAAEGVQRPAVGSWNFGAGRRTTNVGGLD